MESNDYKMDLFIEKIITRKRTTGDYLQLTGIVMVGVILLFAMGFVKLPDIVSQFTLFIWAAIFYGIYRFSKSKNIEFEYAVTNGDMDIDKIIAQKKRKRLFSGHCREYEIIAKVKSDKYTQNYASIQNKVVAVTSLSDDDVFFLVAQYKGSRTIVYFQPNEKMMKSFKTYISRKIFE